MMERISTVIYFIVFKVENFYSYRVKVKTLAGSLAKSDLADLHGNSVCTPDKSAWLIRLVNRFINISVNISDYKPSIDSCVGSCARNRSMHVGRNGLFAVSDQKAGGSDSGGCNRVISDRFFPRRFISNNCIFKSSTSQRFVFQQSVASRCRGRSGGFTLIEIAIVLVVVTLILAGVLKGQSLIDSARVRSMATDVTGIRAAWYSFQDRYRSLPGDFPNARTQIDDATVPGNGNGKIDDSRERAGVWQQMALAGFIKGSFDGLESSAGTAQDMNCSATTCPRNPYNGFYKISYGAQAENAAGPAHEIFTGDSIPVNILAELDNKLDDGKAGAGRFRVHRDFSGSCSVNGEWNVSAGHANCAAVLRD